MSTPSTPAMAVFPATALRASARIVNAKAEALAELNAAVSSAGLPAVEWHICPVFGLTGTVSGTAERVERVVAAWAEEFATKPLVVAADGGAGGFAVVHLPVVGIGITVGGRLRPVRSR